MLLRVVSLMLAVSLALAAARGASAASDDAGPPSVVVESAEPGIPEHAAAAVRDAVLARIPGRPSAAPPIRIVLRSETAEILTDSLRREIAIGSWASPQAARTVALHVMDLLQPTPALAPVGAPVAARASRTRVTVAGGPSFGHGIGDANPWTGGLLLDIALGRSRLSGGVGAAWSRGATSASTPFGARYDLLSARVTAAMSVRELAIGAHAGFGRIYMDGVQSWTTNTLIASPFVRSRLALAENVVVLIEAGVEVVSRPARLRLGDRTLYATPRAAPYLGLVLAWTVRS